MRKILKHGSTEISRVTVIYGTLTIRLLDDKYNNHFPSRDQDSSYSTGLCTVGCDLSTLNVSVFK